MAFDLTGIINASMPAILALLQRRHQEQHPGAPALTDAEVFAAMQAWAVSTVAKSDALAADVRARNPGS